MLNAIIMASGKSNRMKTNKLLLPYKGKCLIEHILDNVLKSHYLHTILIASDEEVLALGRDRGINVIQNLEANNGQSESIKLGILNSPESDGYAFFTGDQPLLDAETIDELIAKFYQFPKSIIVPSYQNKRGTPVLFPKSFREDLLSLSGDNGGKIIINKNLNLVKLVEVKNEFLLMDIDTQEDYQKLIHEHL